ncbi:MAG: LacI family transcriptional regulator [Anaerolineaceae bacterium]|nr:MAG: LacI family transcriptional regulator [Anaerolineaceae bacterium]
MTIKDVAREANVSVATVSRVINNVTSVDKNLRIRVERAIEKLDFKPNQIAKSLKQDITNTVGIIVADISNSFFSGVIREIERTINPEGYALLMASTDGNVQKEKDAIEMMHAKRVDGLVICHVSDDIEALIKSISCPVISFDRNTLSHIRDTVYINKERSMYDAVTYLLKRGHRDIAVISGAKGLSTNFDRYIGYMRAYYDWSLMARKEDLYFGEFTKEYGKRSFESIMQRDHRPTAIVTGSADITEGILAKANELKVRIPEDISLVSFGAISFQDVLDLKITYVDEMYIEIGKNIGEMMLSRLKSPKISPRLIVLESGIISGNSVKTLDET